jgi:phosphate acyltransferase
MRIAVDLNGGDKAPEEILKGVLEFAQSDPGNSFILCAKTGSYSAQYPFRKHSNLLFKYFADAILMNDTPVQSKKDKPDNTISGMLHLLKNGGADCAFSCGNTGAVILNAMDIIGLADPKIPPSLISFIPRYNNIPAALFDSGALGNQIFNADTYFSILPEAVKIYSALYGKEFPSVKILNIGAEQWKGTPEHKKLYQLLSGSSYNFTGNMEGDELICPDADIIVSGGYTGNVALKLLESFNGIFRKFKDLNSCKSEDNYLNFLSEDFCYESIGAAPLTGVNGKVMIGHGKSSSKAVYSALELCVRYAKV